MDTSPRPNIYFIVHDWMISRLDLKRDLLTTFAYIYSVSKMRGKVSEQDICKTFRIAPRTARDRLKKLFDRGLLKRKIDQGCKGLYWAEVEKVHKKAFILEI